MIRINSQITVQQAAELLNVSRPYVVTLLERGEIPVQEVGSRQRVRLADVLAFRTAHQRRGKAALDELAVESQDLGLGY